ncbi:hypothetical protein O181_048786 [Austropuccinia psidii MF-1]|uniref:UBC core domain-containing protein n=1 Tax=Austropuccinia psidii MF-1 TaxID=1389203 RepID=A0A9Q3DRA5_9BASI|nr:hypothetical protein [Austropuccinia psidii MF-1]
MTQSKSEILLEFNSLRLPGHCPLGMWLIPSSNDIHKWSGTLFLHRGYYSNGIFKFLVKFSKGYPYDRKVPKILFLTECFHPLIEQSVKKDQNNKTINQQNPDNIDEDEEGFRFDSSQRFKSWEPHQDFIVHLLHYLKSCFKRSGLESIISNYNEAIAFNKHAFRLYRDQTHVFATLAAQSANLSSSPSTLYQPSQQQEESASNQSSSCKNLIQFSPLTDQQWTKLRSRIFSD